MKLLLAPLLVIGLRSERVDYERVGPVYVPSTFVKNARIMGAVENPAQCGVHCSNWHWLQCNAFEIRTISRNKICHLYLLFNGRQELVDDSKSHGTSSYVYIRQFESPFEFPKKLISMKSNGNIVKAQIVGWNLVVCKQLPDIPGPANTKTRANTVTIVDGTKIFTAGGVWRRQMIKPTWILDLATKPLVWQRKADMLRKGRYNSMFIQYERFVFSFVGMDWKNGKRGRGITNIDYFDLDKNRWVDTNQRTKDSGYVRSVTRIPGTTRCIIVGYMQYSDIFDLKTRKMVKSIRHSSDRFLKHKPSYAFPLIIDGKKGLVAKVEKSNMPHHFLDLTDPSLKFKPLDNIKLPPGKIPKQTFRHWGGVMVIDKDQARFWNKEAKRFTSIGDLPIAATAGGNAAFEKLICD